MKKSLVISIIALLVAVAALVKDYLPCAKKAAEQNNAPVNVEQILKDHPEYVINALQAYEVKAREEAEAKLKAKIKENEEALKADNAPFQGNADAKIVMVEFFDYACGYCHRLFPEMNQILAKNSDVKLVLRPLAFVSPHSEYAAKAVLAANEQGKFTELHTALFTVQKALSEELINELAEKAGIDVNKMKEDMKSEKVEAAFAANNELAQNIEVGGVPTLILNGELIQPFSAEIQAKIDAAK